MQRPLLFLAALAVPAPAWACGGLFCNVDAPVDQAGEQIAFGVDGGSGTTTVHVQVTYQGASEDFAWVVPVPAEPELGVSSQSLFTALNQQTAPIHRVQYDYIGDCDWGWEDTGDWDVDTDADTDTDAAPSAGNDGVTIVAQEQVGPYDTVTLQAESAEALLTWLQANDYDLPSTLDTALAPYVASEQYFVALKLSAGNDTGDLRPLAMTYDGTAASIPLQLTSVAATPDMRLTVYVLGRARAVPDNYLHVVPNDGAIDWFAGGANYEDVITLAANEAGGQAFATDSSMAAPERIWWDGNYDVEALRRAEGPVDWVNVVTRSGLPANAQLLDVLQRTVPVPEALAADGLSATSFYNCVGCYAEYIDLPNFTAEAATLVLEREMVEGLRAANDMLERHDHITRLTSSMDASEMTMDPVFVFNADLPQQIDRVRTATVTVDCDNSPDNDFSEADRTLTLPDGRILPLQSDRDLADQGLTPFESLDIYTRPAAILIEDLGPDGQGEVIADFRDSVPDGLPTGSGSGCSCTTGSTTPWPAALLLVGLLGLRRQRNA